jgi:hypothetical protein
VTNNAGVGGDLSVTGNTSIGGTLGVTGNSTLGNVSIGGTLGVTGASTLSTLSAGATSVSTLNTSGAATLNSATVTNNASVGGDLTVSGNASVTGATSLGNTSVAGTLTMTTFNTAGVVKNNASGVLSTGLVTLTTDVAGVLPIVNGGTGATTASGARTNLGLGTIATQDANNVTVTGGTIDGTTIGGTTAAAGSFTTLASSGTATLDNVTVSSFTSAGIVKNNATGVLSSGQVSLATEVTGTLPLANGGTGSTTASGARTNLGLGTIATQDANSVTVTGGTIDGTTIGGTTAAAGSFTTLASSGNTTVGGDIDVASGLLSTDASTSIVDINGDVDVQSDLITGGNVDVGNDLTVTGGTSLNGTLDVTGTATFTLAPTVTAFNAAGVVTNDNAGVLSSLPLGSANQFLRVNGGGTALEFAALPSSVANGTTTDATLRWDGTAWVENTNLTSTSAGNTNVAGTLDVADVVSITDNTAASNTTTGALVVSGGVGIAGNTHIGGTLDVSSTSYLRNLTGGVGAELLVNDDQVLLEANGATNQYAKLSIGGANNNGSFMLQSVPDNSQTGDVEITGDGGIARIGTSTLASGADANLRVDATAASPIVIMTANDGNGALSEVSVAPTGVTIDGAVHVTINVTAVDPYPVAANDYIIIVDAATAEVDLPVGAAGRMLIIKNESGAAIDINPDANESVDGAAVGVALNVADGAVVKLVFSGTNWYVVGN